ncbi:phosphotransferase enzyme family protein [Brevibacillus fortis]|uniref:Aminoglycoside phosphotransferase domain-containing protein n=1 Tax=Brevibacillus fortis TaxID=2126352 RepID=A0A2P7V7W9_9BACL|nr:phosphotransferase [Brevibacillus fortis]PSJ95314.1 hypothetical protein C7R93_12870 [Brevibacillus fortis]
MVTDTVKNQVFARLGCQSSEAKLLGGYNQHVFEINRGEKLVVKIEEGTAASEQGVLSECEWLSYMHEHGLHVVRPLRIAADTYLNRISEECFFVVYEKVEGVHVSSQDKDVWSPALFEQWGEMMGKMHTLAKTFQPVHQRQMWFENRLFQEDSHSVDPILIEKLHQYRHAFKSLPISKDHFGLIHGDLHHHNFLRNDVELTILDFGDSEYHWFAYDIAIAVYHTAQTVPKGLARKEFVHSFFQSFMEGYSRGNPSTEFLSLINFFMDYRHLFSYIYHSVYADKSQLTEQQRKYLEAMRLSLQYGESYLGFPLGS